MLRYLVKRWKRIAAAMADASSQVNFDE